MRVELGMCLVFVVQNLIPQCKAQYSYWLGGDWAVDINHGTEEPVGNASEWAHYLNTLGEEYDEYPDPKKTKKPFVRPDESDLVKDPPEWYPLPAHEDPYMAVIYRRDAGPDNLYKQLFPGEPDPGPSHISPGTACGGALLAQRHVLTSCGCVLTMITTLLSVQSPFPTPGTSTYDIYDFENGKVPPIYVARAVTEFKPDFKHEIERDVSKWALFPSLKCTLLIEDVRKSRNYDELKKIALINAQPVVLPFSPEIKTDFIRFSPKWPPVAINRNTDADYKVRVDLISIGMKLSKPGRHQFFSSTTGSVTRLKHCNVDSIVCNNSRVSLQTDRATCFCPVTPGIHKLSGGVIGWPLVLKGSLVGITGSERHPTDGTVVGIILYDFIKKRIEDYITKEVLEDQNTPPPKYREKSLKKGYLLYDYDTQKGKKNRPRSNASCTGPTAIVVSVAIISWTITV